MDQDFLLTRKMKNGDEAAMELFVRKYYPQILQYCRHHCFSREQAEDLAQETFEKFFRALAGYQHIGKAGNYLYTIARNQCIDFARRRHETTVPEIPGTEENTLSGIDDRLDIERALSQLKEEMREVIILHCFQELKVKEIAKILGIGIPLVKYRIRTAKRQLRAFMGREERNERA